MVLTMGGKGGVGKTSVKAGLAEWYDMHQIPVTLLDLDTENKARGSLTHFFGGRVPKVNIHTPAGLDAFVDHLSDGAAPVILADMGAGSGQVTYDWVFSGDTKQIESVEAGDALRVLEKESRLKTVSLTQVRRQTAQGYREAIQDLRRDPARGFRKLEDIGAVREVAWCERTQAVARARLS